MTKSDKQNVGGKSMPSSLTQCFVFIMLQSACPIIVWLVRRNQQLAQNNYKLYMFLFSESSSNFPVIKQFTIKLLGTGL